MENSLDKLLVILDGYWEAFLAFLPRLALAIVVIIIGNMIARWLSRFFNRRLTRKAHDPLMGRFLGQTMKTLLLVGVIILALYTAGLGAIAGGIFALAGASTLILGFAFRDIGENFIAGIILAFNRPFSINDTIMVDSTFGRVKGLDFRYTHIKTFDGKDVYVPNGTVLTEEVVNYTQDGYFRFDFTVGIAYEDDIEAAKAVIRRVLDEKVEVMKDPDLSNFVVEDELAVSTVNLKVFFWVETTDWRQGALELRGTVIRSVKQALEQAGFSLPADIVELKVYGGVKDLPMRLRKDIGEA